LLARGERFPALWAMDACGQPSDDPAAVISGGGTQRLRTHAGRPVLSSGVCGRCAKAAPLKQLRRCSPPQPTQNRA
jgi:hypothetical protein